MSAIPCSSVSMRTMADGTLRLSIDIEPANAQDAFRLFAAPGTPAAIAALQVGYAQTGYAAIPANPGSAAIDKPKGGALAKLAGRWCADKTFQSWISDDCATTENEAALCVRALCGVKSRRHLDHDPAAAERFNKLIRGPYMKWRASKGLA